MTKTLKNSLLLVVVFFSFLSGGVSTIFANEGEADLKNLTGGKARCRADSALIPDFSSQTESYTVLLKCRDLVYPISANMFNYTLWVREEGTGNSIRLGDVGIGKKIYTTQTPFTSYFVTEERTTGAKQPSDRVVMEGQVTVPSILADDSQAAAPATLAPAPTSGFAAVNTDTNNTRNETNSNAVNAFSALKIVGGVLVLSVLLIIIIALVSASRRRPIDL